MKTVKMIEAFNQKGFGIGKDGKNGFYIWGNGHTMTHIGTSKISEAIKYLEAL